MADIITIVSGDEVKVQPLNHNFGELEQRIINTNSTIETIRSNVNSSLINMQAFLEADISAQIGDLTSDMTSSIETLNEFTGALDKRIGEMEQCEAPLKTALIDWTFMATKAGVAVDSIKKNINNTTTGISAYGGNNNTLHEGDIYLKEDFTNYPQIMVVYTEDNGNVLQAAVWESWLLDYLLSQSKGRTSITKMSHGYDNYWNVWGYQYTQIISGVEYHSEKDFFFCNSNQNCGIVEIYGLINQTVDTYIRPNTSAFSSSWLADSDEEDAEALNPQVGVIYEVKTDGTYKDKKYRWDSTDTQYKEVIIV